MPVEGILRAKAPKAFRLHSNYRETMQFVEGVRVAAVERHQPVILDLSEIQEIGVAAALLLVSEIDRAARFGIPRERLLGVYPRDASVRRFLQELGFFRLIKVRDPDFDPDTASPIEPQIEYLHFIAGRRSEAEKVKDLRLGLERLIGNSMPEERRQVFFDSLFEAMVNANEHAYSLPSTAGLPVFRGLWWMSAAVDRQSRAIRIVIFDQGVSIPVHLKTAQTAILESVLTRFGLGRSDGELIKAATRVGESGTGANHRGLGLPAIKELVRNYEDCHLRIFSGSGLYAYDGVKEDVGSLPCPVGGTMLQWRLTFNALMNGDPT